MANDGSAQSTAIWPMPAFRFRVTVGDNLQGAFQEVTGLNTKAQVLDYRYGPNSQFSTIRMPGIPKIANVTLKRGIFRGDNTFWSWYATIQQNTIKRQTVVIELLDDENAVQMKWTLSQAWPTKVTGTDMRADEDEVAVHTMELAFESLAVDVG